MPKNEDGEFELILGNRQLLSVFFIVVVLLGVFFTMGYIVGRNSPVATPEVAAEKKETTKPLVVGPPTAASGASGATQAPSKEAAAQATAPTETAPQQPEAAKPEPVRQEPVRQEAPAKPEPAKPKPAPGEDRPSGTYLQLAATTQREADIEVDVLRKKGFRALAAEIPEKPGMFRVLVGPVPEASINKMKSDLQNAGFPGDKAIRRTM